MHIRICLLLGLLLMPPSAWGQVAETGKTEDVVDISLLQATGVLTPLSPHTLELDRLALRLEPDGEDFLQLVADYTLQNLGPGGVVSMGIPFDVLHRLPFYTSEWDAEHLPDLSVRLEGEELPIREVQQALPVRKGYPRFRHWRRLEVPVPDSETVHLTMTYRMRLELNDVVAMGGSGDAQPSPRKFTLLLQPDSQSFRTVRVLDVQADLALLDRLGMPILAQQPPGWKRDSTGTSRLTIYNAKLDQLQRLTLSYDVRDYQRSVPYRTPFPEELLDSVRAGIFRADAALALDGNLRTGWTSDTTLATAWWEATVHDLPLGTIALLNGSLEGNGRGYATEVVLTANCLDAPGKPQSSFWRRIALRPPPPQPIAVGKLPEAVQTLLTIPDPPGTAWRVKIRVTRVAPGATGALFPEVYLLP